MTATEYITLDTAHRILPVFGITQPTDAYNRWVTANGFSLDDLRTVLADSRFVFLVDWRAVLVDELDQIAAALAEWHVKLDIDLPRKQDINQGWIACAGKRAFVKYATDDGDDFCGVIRSIQSIIPPTIEFRQGPDNDSSDTWEFAVLLAEEWSALEAHERPLIRRLYQPLPGGHNSE